MYRTEFFYLNKADLPDEEEQYENYRQVASDILPHPIIIRTLDLGGDKFLDTASVPAGVESVSRLPRDPFLPGAARHFQGAACARSCAPACWGTCG